MQYEKLHAFDFKNLIEYDIDTLQISTNKLKEFLTETQKKYVHSVHPMIKSQTEDVIIAANALPDVCSANIVEAFCYDVKVGSSVFKTEWKEIYQIAQQEIYKAIDGTTVAKRPSIS